MLSSHSWSRNGLSITIPATVTLDRLVSYGTYLLVLPVVNTAKVILDSLKHCRQIVRLGHVDP